jgi:imidazolonepropionase-like amidohydrolase
MRPARPIALALCVAVSAAAAVSVSGAGGAAEDGGTAFVNVTVLDGAGGRATGRTVVVRDGRVAAIGDAAPGGARRIEVAGAVLTPGLIDAGSRDGYAWFDAEITREMTADTDTFDLVDARHVAFEDAARAGVTAVCVTPGERNVVGGRARVLHTRTANGRAEPIEGAAHTLFVSMTGDASNGNFPPRFGSTTSIYARRPNTRMGVVWMLRQVFLAAKGVQASPNDAALGTYREVLAGERPVRITVHRNQDITAALRLGDEVGFVPSFEGCEEAWQSAAELARRGVSVVYGPSPHERSGVGDESSDSALSSPAILRKAGVTLALTAGNSGGRRLRDQALFALRYGLEREAALAAVTSVPAKLLGLEGRGRVAVKQAADLVLWSGDPLSPTTRPLVVMIDGHVVHRDASMKESER